MEEVDRGSICLHRSGGQYIEPSTAADIEAEGRSAHESNVSSRATDFPYSFPLWIAAEPPKNVGQLETKELG
jgi:hypothetical protein